MNTPINIRDYQYHLPEERIALHPLAQRDQSRLLVYRKGVIQHKSFTDLPDLLPDHALVFFNNTKVIPARILFQKETGAEIEIFLLNPVAPSTDLQRAMLAKETVTWKCAIGNLKRWPDELILVKNIGDGKLQAQLAGRKEGMVTLTWSPASLSFAEVVGMAGNTPLPPYLHRKADDRDRERYQTIYSVPEGAVAAPTAGLHFTEPVLKQIQARQIDIDFLTLHVSAGTFQPVKVSNAADHPMHAEQVIISQKNVENLLDKKHIVAVGTTSMRTLESLYWYGVKLQHDPNSEFIVTQKDPYQIAGKLPSKEEAFEVVLRKMKREQLANLGGTTSIYIVPGYQFKVCNSLVTNFHQPGSTLILLVAAFIGKDWRHIYEEALALPYRFLSYGDSSYLVP